MKTLNTITDIENIISEYQKVVIQLINDSNNKETYHNDFLIGTSNGLQRALQFISDIKSETLHDYILELKTENKNNDDTIALLINEYVRDDEDDYILWGG